MGKKRKLHSSDCLELTHRDRTGKAVFTMRGKPAIVLMVYIKKWGVARSAIGNFCKEWVEAVEDLGRRL